MLLSESVLRDLELTLTQKIKQCLPLENDHIDIVSPLVSTILNYLKSFDLSALMKNKEHGLTLFNHSSRKISPDLEEPYTLAGQHLYITLPMDEYFLDTAFALNQGLLSLSIAENNPSSSAIDTIHVDLYSTCPDREMRSKRSDYRRAQRVIEQSYRQPKVIREAIDDQPCCIMM